MLIITGPPENRSTRCFYFPKDLFHAVWVRVVVLDGGDGPETRARTLVANVFLLVAPSVADRWRLGGVDCGSAILHGGPTTIGQMFPLHFLKGFSRKLDRVLFQQEN